MHEQENIEKWVKTAVDFHGHLGPFLVIGVRMGMIGLRELQTSRGDLKLQALVTLEPKVPYSCAVDGIQVATQCTVGNGRLRIADVKNTVSANFQFDSRKEVMIALKHVKLEELKKALPKEAHSERNIQLAREITSLRESELFSIVTK